MERTKILDLMSELKLFGMKAAFDEVMANGVKRRHEPERIMGDPETVSHLSQSLRRRSLRCAK